MALVGPAIRSRELRRSPSQRCDGVTLVHGDFVFLDGQSTHVAVKPFMARQPFPFAPRSFEFAPGANGRPFVGREHGQKTLHPHHAHSRDCRNRRLIHREQFGSQRRRAHHARMQHSGNLHVVHVLAATGTFRRNVRPRQGLSYHRVGHRIAQQGLWIDFQGEPFAAQQRPHGNSRAPGTRTGLSVFNGQFADRTMQLIRRQTQQCFARGRGRAPNLHAATGNSGGSAGATVIGRKSGVAIHYRHLFDGHADLFGDHLRKRNAQAGADIHFAGIDGYRAIRRKSEKTVDLSRVK